MNARTVDEGATPEPEIKMECPGDGTGRSYRHSWIWVWEGPPENRIWTDAVRCQTCGAIEPRTR